VRDLLELGPREIGEESEAGEPFEDLSGGH
jgi:hypothetical protein